MLNILPLPFLTQTPSDKAIATFLLTLSPFSSLNPKLEITPSTIPLAIFS
ncbi:hypothetical protein K1514_02825 [Paraclostridium bifermentans]|nr:hypothetical protein [Paraclostridium bifermentans]MBZ6004813.1 hypothetical protein [Paraclostridium bifermentans]MDO7203317.1 hypothetical protein [Paraclostridium bifermentans]